MAEPLPNKTPETRRFYLDVLRVVSVVCVFLSHAAAQNWYRMPVRSFSWQALNFYDCIFRWSVLEFALISGVLFLPRDIPLRMLFRKYILRIVTAFLFWSAAHALMYHFYGDGWRQTIKSFLLGPSHFWYLYMIVGVYLLQPLLRKIAADSRLSAYYCILALIFAFLIPQALSILGLFRKSAADFGTQLYGKLQMYFVLGFPFYFLLGYWLDRVPLQKRQLRFIWVFGALGFAATAALTALISWYKNVPVEVFLGRFTVNGLLECVLVFVLVKKTFETREVSARTKAIFAKLSKWSFGAFLCHVIIQVLLNRVLGFNTASLPTIVSVPLLGLTVTVLAFAVSAALHHIPILKKYIV